MEKELKIGFIGAGNMARAIIEGALNSSLFKPSQFNLSYPSAKTKRYSHLNIENEFESNFKVVENSDVIILCVKPQMLEHVCNEIKNYVDPSRHLILSIVAGVTLEKLKRLLSVDTGHLRIGRIMMNTAAMVGQSCSVFSQNGQLTESDKKLIQSLLSSVGLCVGELNDSYMDAALGVCASGIAYMYMMVDAMADGGVKMGLTRDVALKLSMQTMKGASELMLSQAGKKHPMQLKDEVCSPGGTTIQGVHELERNGFRNSVICAVEAAALKAKQFSQ